MSDWICLDQIRFPCRIGTYWAEHQREQPLEVSVRFAIDLTAAANEDLSHSIDYAQVLTQVELIAQRGGWRLLETLGLVLVRWFLLEPAPGEARGSAARVRVVLSKPEACGGRAVPSVEIERSRAESRFKHVEHEGGARQVIVGETQWVTVSRLELAPGSRWHPPQASVGMLLSGAMPGVANSLRAQPLTSELKAEAGPAAWLVLSGPALRE